MTLDTVQSTLYIDLGPRTCTFINCGFIDRMSLRLWAGLRVGVRWSLELKEERRAEPS